MTILEKRWLKAIFEDPRIKLFGVDIPDLEGIKPLFTTKDYKIYDQYLDGDPFEDEAYIHRFQMLLSAIKNNLSVKIDMINRHGKSMRIKWNPKGFEYSVKDDKIRLLATGGRYDKYNLGRIKDCQICEDRGLWKEKIKAEKQRDLELLIINKRNALERVMMHFAHFEKEAERIDDKQYILRLKYYENDETELVIRILSFGPQVKVLGPKSFVNLIKERLILQKSCGL